MTNPGYDVLLLDFGGVCLLNPVELHDVAEARLGLAPGTFDWLGPVDPSTDALWRELTMGETLQEREYWAQRASDVGQAAGQNLSLHDYMQLLYDPPTPSMIRAGATTVVRQARAAGYRVSVLTNDLRSFHGADWQRQVPFFDLIDHVVDCSDTNILKPDPRSYQRASEIVQAEPGEILFIDDQRLSVAGAEQSGIDALWFDISHPTDSWQRVADHLGLN